MFFRLSARCSLSWSPAAYVKHSPHDLLTDADNGHYYHPSLRNIRPQRLYNADIVNKRTSYEPRKTETCTKQTQWSSKLTPGIFTLVCPHNICYGFSFMRSHESPKTAFSLLYDRFRSLRNFFVYDNACHLDRYLRAREPGENLLILNLSRSPHDVDGLFRSIRKLEKSDWQDALSRSLRMCGGLWPQHLQ